MERLTDPGISSALTNNPLPPPFFIKNKKPINRFSLQVLEDWWLWRRVPCVWKVSFPLVTSSDSCYAASWGDIAIILNKGNNCSASPGKYLFYQNYLFYLSYL